MIQPLGTAFEVESCARALAQQHRLVDASGQLHCWHCGEPCPWHVSLHCSDRCRAASKSEGAERRREQRERERQEEPSRPVQRVASRRYGDDY